MLRHSELGQVQHQLDRNITWLCCKKGAGQIGKDMAPGATHARQETQQHVAQSQQSPKSRCARAVAEQRLSHHTTTGTNHTRRRALRPPCLLAGFQRFCAPQSRQAEFVSLCRAIWRLPACRTWVLVAPLLLPSL